MVLERRGLAALLGTLAVCAALAVVVVSRGAGQAQAPNELLLKQDLQPHEPYSPPSNMYLWWGPSVNHRFAGSGENIRHILHLGNIEGGEWRDRMFLGNNGVAAFRSQRFRRVSETCCSSIVIPPMEWDFPVYNAHKVIGQRIRNFVANGNNLIIGGGILTVEFINRYFFYQIELADGNYSPGPYRRLNGVPEAYTAAPVVLPQKGIAVTAVKKDSLPSGTEVLWGTPRSSPVFQIKFCMSQNANAGMPPVKVLPRDCAESEKCGRPCSCGYVTYIGYNFQEQYPSRWDKVLRASVEILNPSYAAPASPEVPPKAGCGPQMKDCHDAQTLTVDAGERGRTGESDSSPSVPEKIKEQAQEIKQLTEEVARMASKARKAAGGETEMKKGRFVELAQIEASHPSINKLRKEAQSILEQVQVAEVAKGKAAAVAAPVVPADNADEKLLMKSVLGLSQDMQKVDGKVDNLATLVESRRSHRHRGRRSEGERSERSEHKHADSAEVRALKAKAAKAEARARSEAKELSYEQSVPTPEYHYAEQDHTTPLFDAQGKKGCGTLCKLKQLVGK
ncbi:hypothetical protein T484DRAFT_1930194, partial [Baffinella frigidus]